MSNRATIQDLANLAGVSVSTLDRILNRRSSVKTATLQHVLQVAEHIGFYGAPTIRDRLTEKAPEATFGFLLNGAGRHLYADFSRELCDQTRTSRRVRGQAEVHHLSGLDERETIDALYRLAESCDVIAAVALDTPDIRDAVREIALRGIPIFTMLSDLSVPARAAFIGADPTKIGRGAGWIMHSLCNRPGKVALFVGSHGYLAHRGYVGGFLGYLSENGSPLQVLPAQATEESDDLAEHLVDQALSEHPDLTAIFVAGGGLEGALRTLERRGRDDLTVIGTELSPRIDAALSAKRVKAVLSHPAPAVIGKVIALMEDQIVFGTSETARDHIVPVEIRISETV